MQLCAYDRFTAVNKNRQYYIVAYSIISYTYNDTIDIICTVLHSLVYHYYYSSVHVQS